jgi:hypothetical protein
MTVKLGDQTDAFETTLPVLAPALIETNAAFGDTPTRRPKSGWPYGGIIPGVGGLQIDLASTALVGLGEAKPLSRGLSTTARSRASSALALARSRSRNARWVASRHHTARKRVTAR